MFVFVITELREPAQYKAGTVDLILAADADARVGGDFYDIQPGPHGTRVLVGDVQGKGLAAVEAAAALLGTFREAGYHEADLAVVAARLETRMLRHRAHAAAVGHDEGDRFATAVLLGYPPKGAVGGVAVVEVVLFGHEPPLVVSTGGVRVLGDGAGGGLPLGLGELEVPGDPGDLRATPEVVRVELGADEIILLVTDGVTEARDAQGRFYPLTEALTQALTSDAGLTEPERLVAFVREGALRHSGGRPGDDTTVFAVRMVPEG